MAIDKARLFVADIQESKAYNKGAFENFSFNPVTGLCMELEKDIIKIEYKKRFYDRDGNSLSGEALQKAESLDYVFKRYNNQIVENFIDTFSDEFENNLFIIDKQLEERIYPDLDSKSEEEIDFLLNEINTKFPIIDESAFNARKVVETNIEKMINYYIQEGRFQNDPETFSQLRVYLTEKITEKVDERSKELINEANKAKEQFLNDTKDIIHKHKHAKEEEKLETAKEEKYDNEVKEATEEINKNLDENVDKENTQITTVDVNDAYMAASTYGVAISYDNNTNKFRAFDVDGHELLINTEKDGKLYIGTEEEYICIYYSNEEKTALEVESKDSKVSINQINHAVQVQMGDFAYSVIGNEVTKFTKEGTASPSTLEELKNAMDEQGLKFESIPELATRYKEELEHDSTSRK